MKQKTKEIKYNDLSYGLKIVILLSFCGFIYFLVFVFIYYLDKSDFQSQIDNLPHKVCHNESILEEIKCPSYVGLCMSIDKECINAKNHCYQNITKEVCEIK